MAVLAQQRSQHSAAVRAQQQPTEQRGAQPAGLLTGQPMGCSLGLLSKQLLFLNALDGLKQLVVSSSILHVW